MKVSVVIPVYNRTRLLTQAVRSVSEQTYDNVETIIIDDGSEKQLNNNIDLGEYKDTIIQTHPQNKGANSARNTGINFANGNLVLFLDSDDQIKPEAVENIVQRIETEQNNCLGVSLSREIRRGNGSVEQEINKGRIYKKNLINKNNYVSGIGGKCIRTSGGRANVDAGGYVSHFVRRMSYAPQSGHEWY
ncbi:hypothetical protein Harman_41910 [Haloarcula mannanilytica]|uniref:Glycosyltransferase 2-like domain-containing protein n=1 Tax=Haloarcula mannanilytica TaxID=2509225 RepID=A0A4C2EPG7_9EURY|nr:hypothetical protein Harman_41910 [Haloarcula mannanilytica]